VDARDLADQLGKVIIFRGLSQRELRSLAAAGHVVDQQEGKDVVQEGGGSVGFHLILEGEAEVIRGGRSVHKLGPGDHFGEISLLDGKPRTATVKALSPLRTFSLTSWNFTPLLDANPSMARNLLEGLCAYFREALAREADSAASP
jgi:CRP/FNR family transcriptional regulator, cyclic AMP receptor protein